MKNRRLTLYPAEMTLRPCAGVMCDVHMRCARYALVDGTKIPSAYWLANCAPLGAPDHPAFVDVEFVGPPAPDQFRFTRGDFSKRGTASATRERVDEPEDALTCAA